MQEYIKKILGSGNPSSSHNNTVLIISNNGMEDIIKIVKSLKWITETVQNDVKEQTGGFLSMLLGTLGASLLGNLLIGKGIYRAGKGKGKAAVTTSQWRGINGAGEGVLRAGYGNNNNKMDS